MVAETWLDWPSYATISLLCRSLYSWNKMSKLCQKFTLKEKRS